MVRSLIVTPTEVQPHAVGRNISQSVIECLKVQFRHFAEFFEAGIGKLNVTSHRQIRAVYLE
jgi:hypothetical protein